MRQQLYYFYKDIYRMLGKYKIRILHFWLSRSFWGVFLYRMERGFFLLIGDQYKYIRVLFMPLINIIQAYSNIEIPYKANIKGGLSILHPCLGVVVSSLSCIGSNLTLTGGNVIGARPNCIINGIRIGDNGTLGANAVILGPIVLGHNIMIGASACVIDNFELNNLTLAGVPAKVL